MTGYSIVKKGRKGHIVPLPPLSLLKSIECRLQYTKQGAQFMPNPMWANVKMFSVKTASFPWGLLNEVLSVCENWMSFKPDTFKVVQLKKDKIVPKFSDKLRPYQRDAIQSLCDNNGGILSMPTGSGKTYTALEFLEQYKKRTLVIVPTTYLVEQWKAQSPDYVDVRTYQGIKDYSILNDYDIVVFDECHHVAAATLYKIAMKLKEQVVVGLSATPTREDNEEMKMYGALGKIVYQISLRELINQGYLCDANVMWIDLAPLDDKLENYQDYYTEYIVNNDERNNAIVSMCDTKKILILVGQIDHGKMLLDMLKDKDAVFLCSKSKEMDVEHRIIIATSIFDEGVDLPDREVIIMAAGGKSSVKCTQRIGRVLRTHPDKNKALIIDFIDRCKYLFKHYKIRKELYEEYEFDW
jgi:superfamily II DNA or RNA helicase